MVVRPVLPVAPKLAASSKNFGRGADSNPRVTVHPTRVYCKQSITISIYPPSCLLTGRANRLQIYRYYEHTNDDTCKTNQFFYDIQLYSCISMCIQLYSCTLSSLHHHLSLSTFRCNPNNRGQPRHFSQPHNNTIGPAPPSYTCMHS